MPNLSTRQKLIARRGQIKAELSRFETYINNFEINKSTHAHLETRLETIKNILAEFKTVQTELEDTILLESGNLDEAKCNNDRNEFEIKYYDGITRAKEILSSRTSLERDANSLSTFPSQQTHLSCDMTSNSNVSAKLPPLKLPEFSGSYSDWQRFHDTFQALVHNNKLLANIEKFYYLQTSLKSEAAHVIASLPISDANYSTAWELLKARYENKRAIINAHIKEIFELPVLNKESHVSLRKFLDSFLKNYRSLESLGESVNTWDTVLIYLLVSKLDFSSKREWENFSKEISQPKITDVTKYLTQRCQILEALDNKSVGISTKKFNHMKSFHVTSNNELTCPFCRDLHYIYFCQKFKDLPIHSRYAQAKRLNICTNCLRFGHKVSECKSGGCKKCHKKHNTLLHQNPSDITNTNRLSSLDSQVNNTENKAIANTNSNSRIQNVNGNLTSQDHDAFAQTNYNVLSHYSQRSSEPFVLLSTALVYVYDINEQPVKCRVLLDSGSQSHFVTRNLVDKLNLQIKQINMPVAGINQVKTHITQQVKILLTSVDKGYKAYISCLVIDKITDFTPQQSFNISNLNLPNNLPLADPEFNVASPVDMLIGAGIFYELLSVGQIKLGKNQPILQNTLLGWIVSGRVINSCKQSNKCFFNNIGLRDQVEKFWILEEVSDDDQRILTKEEIECEKHFVENTSRNSTGRFIVKLPLKDNYTLLGSSKDTALQRLYSVERKFSKFPDIANLYKEFMLEYENLEHMSEISLDSQEISSNPIYYLPHHCVQKPDSVTTKTRVVFDASSKTSTNLSLNDVLKVGPVVQNDLFSVLLRFRKHDVVLIGDLTKMYRQILIHPEQRDLQRIVWRENPDAQVKLYRLNTVTYGTASASFLATRCLKQIAIENASIHPIESSIITNDFYVDDLLTGAKNSDSLDTIRKNLVNLLSQYGLEIRKFQSNDLEILHRLNQEQTDSQYLITDDSSTKTLGIAWIPSADCFQNKFTSYLYSNKPATKRTILSFIAKIFDPLGLLGPIVVRAKLIMQALWRIRIDWDESLPYDLQSQWLDFLKQVSQINLIRIPRHALAKNATSIQIHGFCDASEKSYACAIYLRSTNLNGTECHLLCSKSRVAPLKSISLPRLELCGAVLLSRLLKKCLAILDLEIDAIYLWTDSTIVLSWLSCEPKTWKTFISNRVSEIQQLTRTNDWNYVSSGNNAADILSRGTNPLSLINSSIWWHGPAYLLQDPHLWPTRTNILHFSRIPSEIPEFRKQTVSFFCDEIPNFNIFERYSNINKLIRVLAYCFRFLNNLRISRENRTRDKLTILEIKKSTEALIKIVQGESFFEDLRLLRKNGKINPKSKLSSLSPFIDSDGLIRVGGRLNHSHLTYDQKHQIILPYKHPFTYLIIKHEHERSLHSGIQTTLSHIRQNYWPLNGKQAVKSHIKKCMRCFRANPTNSVHKMGELPSARVTPSRPFSSCGVDYAGPFDLKDSKTKNRKIIKGYVCIFICLATKAVHLELVTDLSSDGFSNALKRFVSRRGLCTDIFSDNATNFIGTNNELKVSIQQLINSGHFQDYLNQSHINWHFIPPRSPHFGGLWEASVKSLKHHLKRILFNVPLTFEEFYTLLTQIEAVLNSRPLVPLSSDPNDLDAITPAHFLIGQQLTAVPQRDLRTSPVNHVKRYQHLQQMSQHFWSRWSHDYLHNLQQRTKWQFSKGPPPKIGSLVLLKEENAPPLYWHLGQIVELHPGEDGTIRVVSVKTKRGVFKRAVVKVCLLPIEQ